MVLQIKSTSTSTSIASDREKDTCTRLAPVPVSLADAITRSPSHTRGSQFRSACGTCSCESVKLPRPPRQIHGPTSHHREQACTRVRTKGSCVERGDKFAEFTGKGRSKSVFDCTPAQLERRVHRSEQLRHQFSVLPTRLAHPALTTADGDKVSGKGERRQKPRRSVPDQAHEAERRAAPESLQSFDHRLRRAFVGRATTPYPEASAHIPAARTR
jgi:hypothetical protein